ncbi:MAG TPA: DUF349 domain-containing protein [Stackebrandtia sp.]|jgi:hypothetical protein|uniref:DUF349 domain-containing protein n=1 Tax=Stackebrandtia sp. TaxID=2023065 RepID=UPI002D25CF84|nr:DUF349 domain-containing protein [Stackebrandtia sp.]HZE41814.1 DUF349 domain-containing protein [Stackebrandtia sp.]
MSGENPDVTRFGRIDDDGTVYVKTSAGERVIGSWQAGTPDEGLAHFARRYDDLVTEVDLVAARLNSDSADPTSTAAAIKKLRSGLDEAHAIGDLDALAARLDELATRVEAKVSEAREAKTAARAEAVARKEALAAEAEGLAENSTQWKAAGDRIKEISEEWKAIHGADRKHDQALWKRFATARDAFTRRRGAHFASLDSERKVIATRKEELIAEAEQLSGSTDWGATADQLKGLMREWKAAGRVAPDAEQKLWKRFRAAQDVFFSARSEAFSARDAELKDNLTAKRELLATAEAIDVDADPKAAQSKLREIQGQWDEIGRVPKESAGALQRRLRAMDGKVRAAMDIAWRRTPVSENPLLEQMREQVDKAERQLERAKNDGDAKRIKQAEEALANKRQFLNLAEKAQ